MQPRAEAFAIMKDSILDWEGVCTCSTKSKPTLSCLAILICVWTNPSKRWGGFELVQKWTHFIWHWHIHCMYFLLVVFLFVYLSFCLCHHVIIYQTANDDISNFCSISTFHWLKLGSTLSNFVQFCLQYFTKSISTFHWEFQMFHFICIDAQWPLEIVILIRTIFIILPNYSFFWKISLVSFCTNDSFCKKNLWFSSGNALLLHTCLEVKIHDTLTAEYHQDVPQHSFRWIIVIVTAREGHFVVAQV